MPSGEGKKELWRRDHTLRRWAAQAAPLVRSNLAGAMSPPTGAPPHRRTARGPGDWPDWSIGALPVLGVERTLRFRAGMSQLDPNRTNYDQRVGLKLL